MQRRRSIRIISRRRSRFVSDTKLGHFTLLFCRERQRNVERSITHVHSYCLALALNLSFGIIQPERFLQLKKYRQISFFFWALFDTYISFLLSSFSFSHHDIKFLGISVTSFNMRSKKIDKRCNINILTGMKCKSSGSLFNGNSRERRTALRTTAFTKPR